MVNEESETSSKTLMASSKTTIGVSDKITEKTGKDNSKILVSGAGTIGVRTAKALHDMGMNVAIAKYSGSPIKEIPGITLPDLDLYLIDGDDFKERSEKAFANGMSVKGKIGNLSDNDAVSFDYTDTIGILDVADKKGSAFNIKNGLYPDGKPLLFQGGTKVEDGSDIKHYLSTPQTVCFKKTDSYKKAKQRSCNATMSTTAMGLVLSAVKDPGMISNINTAFMRRFADPEDVGKTYNPDDAKPEHNPRYENDAYDVLPEVKGKMHAMCSKHPWKHFHHVKMQFRFKRSFDFDEVYQAFRDYPRCILVDREMVSENPGNEQIFDAMEELKTESAKLGIVDGDILLPVYNLKQTKPYELVITMFNPQRSVALPSTLDWVYSQCMGKADAFDHVNKNMIWHNGLKISEIKQGMQKLLNREEATVELKN